MAEDRFSTPLAADILVAGAGLAGLAAALILARSGFSVVLAGAQEAAGGGRTVALLDGSVALLKRESLWDAIEPLAAPMRTLRILDDTNSLFPPRPIEFRCMEIGLDAFGWNVENDRMAEALGARALATLGLTRIEAPVAAYDFAAEGARATLADGRAVKARLVVAADGRNSPARKAAGLATRIHRYPQSALTVVVNHRRPHGDCSTEFHTRQGPFTLVPLPANDAAAHRSSLVWVMSDAEAARRAALDDDSLAEAIETQAQALLGAMRIGGKRGVFPLSRQIVPDFVATRLALIGDAAHAFPPIGAQGLNLGLRDAAGVLAAAEAARTEGRDIGAAETLAAYARARRPDIVSRTTAVDGLNRALLAHFTPVDLARGLGLAALGAIGPLRRFVMREGVAPRLGGL